VLQNGIVTY